MKAASLVTSMERQPVVVSPTTAFGCAILFASPIASASMLLLLPPAIIYLLMVLPLLFRVMLLLLVAVLLFVAVLLLPLLWGLQDVVVVKFGEGNSAPFPLFDIIQRDPCTLR